MLHRLIVEFMDLCALRGLSRKSDVLGVLKFGNRIYVNRWVPRWYPWRVRLALDFYGDVYLTPALFDALIAERWISPVPNSSKRIYTYVVPGNWKESGDAV